MRGFLFDVRRYFSFRREEWLSLFLTAAVGGLLFSYNDWGEPFSVGVGVTNLITDTLLVFALLLFQVVVTKLAGIRFGLELRYEKYALGLWIGFVLTFLTFGFLPLFITGLFRYAAIPNLRIGKFRATMAKTWEIGLSLAAGVLALLLLTVLFGLFEVSTGLPLFRSAIIIAVLLALYALIPFPLIETANPYTVYMSRLESLEGNLPGYDIFFFSRFWYFLLAGLTLGFALLSLYFSPSLFVLGLSLLLGVAAVFLYQKSPILYGG